MAKPRKKRGLVATPAVQRHRWRPEYQGRRKVAADVVAEELARMARESGGPPTAQLLVEQARDEQAKLHPELTWDDEMCGEMYRRDEARKIICGIQPIVVSVDTGEETPLAPQAYVHVGRQAGGEVGYWPISAVQESPQLRKQAVLHVLAQIRALARKHEELAGLLGTLEAIEKDLRAA